MGGPDGGNGGKGADIVLEANPHVKTLVDFRFRPIHRARHGEHGRGKNQSGAAEKDIVLAVPAGDARARQGHRRGDRRPRRGRPARRRREGRPRRARQRRLRLRDQPGPAQDAARRAGRGVRADPGAQAARGRRDRRLPERGEEHADRGDLLGEAEDRRLPLHDADAAPGRRAPRGGRELRRRRRAGADPGRLAGRRPRHPLPAPPGADAAARPPRGPLAADRARPARGLARHQRGTRRRTAAGSRTSRSCSSRTRPTSPRPRRTSRA